MGSKLTELLFTEYRRRVLGLLLLHPDEAYHVREIARLTGTVAGTLHKELSKLADAGILLKQTSGNQVLYQANSACPIYKELLSIVKKTFGIVDVLQQALLPLDKEIDFAFVYGSVAKGEETSKSDIDLFIASESVAYADVMNVLTKSEAELGRPVNPSIYSRDDIRKKLKAKNAFLTRLIEQPKLWVKGSDDDIREIR